MPLAQFAHISDLINCFSNLFSFLLLLLLLLFSCFGTAQSDCTSNLSVSLSLWIKSSLCLKGVTDGRGKVQSCLFVTRHEGIITIQYEKTRAKCSSELISVNQHNSSPVDCFVNSLDVSISSICVNVITF